MAKTKKIESIVHFSPAELRRVFEDILQRLAEFPTEIPRISVSECAEMYRVLPTNTPHPGPWRNYMTPYSVEIMDCLSARSPIQEVIWIKCSQIGATAIVENFLGYIIKVVPGPTLYCTSKEDLLKKWTNKRLSPLLISYKLDDTKIFAQHLMKGQRRTGNTQFSKEFPGGSLDMVSAQSESNLRMDSIRYLILDEAGAYPWNVSGFGDPIEIARARTANFRYKKKIFIPSTPGLESECRMWSLFLEGDRRRYHVPCPHCGELQVLRLPSEPEEFYQDVNAVEMKWDTRAGKLASDSIRFECLKCKEPVFEDKKWDIVQRGEWIPTAESEENLKRSYQIGRLYSLMDDWERIIQKEITAPSDPLSMQAHHNHNCGIPFRETSAKPAIERVHELRGHYKSSEIPTGVLYLTAAVDVQLGSETNKDSPARLEMEVCGHGMGYRTWSIMHKVIVGDVWDCHGGAWAELAEFVSRGGLEFRRSDGIGFRPTVIFIDAREGKTNDVVFDFASQWDNVYPSMGARDLKESKTGKAMSELLDEQHRMDVERFRVNVKDHVKYIVISSNIYKKTLYHRLAIRRQEGQIQKPNFCDFPEDYPDNYFEQLTAEEIRADGSFWKPSNRPNEALDLRVLNMCAGEFWLAQEVDFARRKAMKLNKWTREQAQHIKTRHILDEYVKNTARKVRAS